MDHQLVIKLWRKSLQDEAFLATIEGHLRDALGDAVELEGYDVTPKEINLFLLTADPRPTFRRVKDVLEGVGVTHGGSAAFRLVGGARFTSIWPLRTTRKFKAGLTIHSSRNHFVVRLNSGVRPMNPSLRVPPWSGQVVHPVVRVLAWVFAACALLALAGTSLTLFRGSEVTNTVGGLAAWIVCLYVVALIVHVAFKGKAPVTWLPWR